MAPRCKRRPAWPSASWLATALRLGCGRRLAWNKLVKLATKHQERGHRSGMGLIFPNQDVVAPLMTYVSDPCSLKPSLARFESF